MKKLFTIFLGLYLSLLCFGPAGCVTVEKVEVQVDEKKLVEELLKPENIGKVLGTIFSSEEDETASEEEINQFNETKSKAVQGDADAQFTLGENYANGRGMKKDSKEAMKWYRKAADQGHKKAVDIIINAEKEIAELKAKAKAGDAHAQFSLGERYDAGHGIKKDLKGAIKWYRKAAEQGHPLAMLFTSYSYLPHEGKITMADLEQAILWGNQAMIQLSAVNNLYAFMSEAEVRKWSKRNLPLSDDELEEHEFVVEVIQFIQLLMARVFFDSCTEGLDEPFWNPDKLPKGNQRNELLLKHLVVPYAWTIVMAENGIIEPKGKSFIANLITMPINLADEKRSFVLICLKSISPRQMR